MSEEQPKSSKADHLAPWQYKPGQSGNPGGRPKGTSLKEYAKTFLTKMTPEEKEQFLKGLSKDTIWKMAEGNPKSDMELSGEITKKIVEVDE